MWNSIKYLVIRYKIPLMVLVLIWAFIFFINYFAIQPYRRQNKELLKEMKQREKKNELIEIELKKDSLELVEKSKLIHKYEIQEQKYKDSKPLIKIKYEKVKTDYYSNDVVNRKRIFTELANE